MISRIRRAMSSFFRAGNRDGFDAERMSFSQLGEDRIMRMAASVLGISRIRYLDIGCFDPEMLSNTFLFYLQGGAGVCIDPNGQRLARFKAVRPRDQLLEAGVTAYESGFSKYYVLDDDSLNTFSDEEATRLQRKEGHRVSDVRTLPVVNISEVTLKYFPNGDLDLVSLDVEGLDLALLNGFDFEAVRPAIWCVETVEYCRNGHGTKTREIESFMKSRGYFVFADTYINTIFVDELAWKRAQEVQENVGDKIFSSLNNDAT